MAQEKQLTEHQNEQQRIKTILESAYTEAEKLDVKHLENYGLSDVQKERIFVIAKYAQSQKGVSTVLITSFCKKIECPISAKQTPVTRPT